MTGLRRMFRFERAAGPLVVAAIVLGLGAANSPLSGVYQAVHHTAVHVGVGAFAIDEPLIGWINDGLLVFFFLLVGLEIKRELLEGHLSTPARAALPAFAAIGGMLAPAAIYAGLNWSDPIALRGWAIPTATDIVLALSIVALLGPRVPTGLKVFLTAVAIFDDIGAVLIIAMFYGEDIAVVSLAVAGLAFAGLFALNRYRIARPGPWMAFGLVLWVAMLEAGVEAALAGVLVALTVPLRAPDGALSPLREAERRLHPWTVLVIVPLFAFFNAGIVIDGAAATQIFGPVSFGVVGGLLLGKPLGVFGATWAAVRLGFGQLPAGVRWRQILGVALLAGIGFTMSLFIATLAFSNPGVIASAKLAILAASLLSAAAGTAVLLRS